MLLPEGGKGRDSQLKELRKKVSKLKSDIPFNLIAPPEQPNPHVNWRPRPSPDQLNEISLLDLIKRKTEPALPRPNPSKKRDYSSVPKGLKDFHLRCLLPFLEFPPKAIIKRSILSGWVFVSMSIEIDEYLEFLVDFNQAMDCLMEKGYIIAVKKKASLTVSGYQMYHSTHYALSHCNWPRPYPTIRDRMCLGLSIDKEEEDHDVFYSGSSGKFPPYKFFDILHLGKWKKSSPQHIEFIDSFELFFKDFGANLRCLEYISLRGISMIQELPKLITGIVGLKILDLKACYNLEAIPSSIANLKHSLRHLDMSECYFLENMPKALATLYGLNVLNGFYVGEVVNENSCSLEDLLPLQELVKLNIYTSMKEFPNTTHLRALRKLQSLRSLTISWGGCKSSPKDRYVMFPIGNIEDRPPTTNPDQLQVNSRARVKLFSFNLEKLDLQCVPRTVTRSWLNPSNFPELKRLYIRGGQFYDLSQLLEGIYWNVEILRLRHLKKLNLRWSELRRLFPELRCLEKVDCPNLHWIPCDKDGLWMRNAY